MTIIRNGEYEVDRGSNSRIAMIVSKQRAALLYALWSITPGRKGQLNPI